MKHGYTLIEILVVISITAVLFTIGYTNFQDYSRQQSLLQAVRSIQSDLKSAQENAIAGTKPSNCSGTLNGYQFNRTSTTSYELDILCSGGNVVQKTTNMPAGITMSGVTRNPTIFKTLAQGTNIPAGNSTVITISQSSTGNTKTITIGANGSIQ